MNIHTERLPATNICMVIDFLVAPVYQNTKADKEGNDIRNGIYLPEGTWIDYFSGEKYEGNRILSNFDTPVWKLPVFVKTALLFR